MRVGRLAPAHAASCPTRRESRRDGAASVLVAYGPAPPKQKINLAKVLALLNAAWPNRSGLEKIEDKSSWDSESGMGAGLTDLFSRGYRERDAGCPTRAVSRVGRDADGIRRFCECEARLSGPH
jgi:hypothetical protein